MNHLARSRAIARHSLRCIPCLLCLAVLGCHPSTEIDPTPSKPPPSDREAQPAETWGIRDAKHSRPLRVPAGGELPPLPFEPDVIAIELHVKPPNSDEPILALTVADRDQIGMFLGQLGRIDWKQKGVPLEQIGMIAPDIEMKIYEKQGIHRHYAFYWQEKTPFVDNVTNRMLEADIMHLRLLVVDALLCELVAERRER